MKRKDRTTKLNWRHQGEAPDYRFSLANERTYLAWIRTALALLAGAIGIDQLTPDLANPEIRIFLSTLLCLCSGLLAIFAYKRWSLNEKAMRNKQQLPYTSFLKVISAVLLFLTLAIIFTISI
ncbi:YidH family protein [Vibrio sp. MA40-2]|uniref:YidH family protein n=1 Tax=Vibrio sp. MA40-2 TaxID=3391828 RepID=UPI0039A46E73